MSEYPTKYPYLRVLNKGFVALIAHSGSDASVARDARVQPEAEWRPDDGSGGFNDPRLLRHLLLSNPVHSSPFEKTTLGFWVKAPIFVYREWHRHRVWSFNEESARYKKLDPDFYVPDPKHVGKQGKKNHQSRDIDFEASPEAVRASQLIESSQEIVYSNYERLLRDGVPREVARSVLPVGIYSQMVAKVDLWNFMKFLDLRAHPDAQYEIQQYAYAMWRLVKDHCDFDIIMSLYEERRS